MDATAALGISLGVACVFVADQRCCRALPHNIRKGDTMGLFSRNSDMPKYVFHYGEWQDASALIGDHWLSLAGMAWAGYQSYGRGAVVVGQNEEVEYVAAAMPALAKSREPIAPKFRRDCAKYHHEREFVILVSGASDDKALRNGKMDSFCGIVKSEVTPPQAHEAVRAWEMEELRRLVAEGQ
jgi:hypothetical protein